MTDTEIRIAIAEACGWKHEWLHGGIVPSQRNDLMDGDSFVFKASDGGGYVGSVDLLPDYPNDLNAMHEAEKVLLNTKDGTWISYRERLSFVKDIKGGVFHATARQRAEAFLRTLGKWTDD